MLQVFATSHQARDNNMFYKFFQNLLPGTSIRPRNFYVRHKKFDILFFQHEAVNAAHHKHD